MRTKLIIKLVLVGITVCALLTACGAKLDMRAYLQAMLDLSYKGDSTDYVNLELGTVEEADAVFERGIDSEMSAFKEKLQISESLEEDFRTLFKEIYAKADYTVGEAARQPDGSYTVEITYARMKVFEPMFAIYEEKIEALPEAWAVLSENPSQEEMREDMNEALRDALRESMDHVEYAEPETLTIRISLVDNRYTPNSQDVEALEKALFDSDYSSNSAEE
ncbi:MAG: hypothetical protein K2N89_06205 [Lachnospiraceae bacterium]|nr:hypothetical protein [Lachnospiraceae bacterium]